MVLNSSKICGSDSVVCIRSCISYTEWQSTLQSVLTNTLPQVYLYCTISSLVSVCWKTEEERMARKEVRGFALAARSGFINQSLYKQALLREGRTGICWFAGSEAGKKKVLCLTTCVCFCICFLVYSCMCRLHYVYLISPQGSLSLVLVMKCVSEILLQVSVGACFFFLFFFIWIYLCSNAYLNDLWYCAHALSFKHKWDLQ